MSISRRHILAQAGGSAALLCFESAALGRVVGDSRFAKPIAETLAEAMANQVAPGFQLAVMEQGQFVYHQSGGKANLATGEAVSSTSVFRIASLSKQFTAAAILKLAQMGKLELNAPISRYLPFTAVLPEIRVIELIHQTAGLHSDESEVAEIESETKNRTQIDLAKEIAAQSNPVDFLPGTAWFYSNANYIMAGALIEQVSGKALPRAFRELIFSPLRLKKIAMDYADDDVARRVVGYSHAENQPPAFVPAAFMKVEEAGGAGALRGTASDLCRWHHALLNGRLLDPAHLQIMLAPGRLRDGRLSGANRFSPEDAHYGDVQYGCGVLVSPASDAHPNIMHYGFISGFSAMLLTELKARRTVAILFNADPGPALPFSKLRKLILT